MTFHADCLQGDNLHEMPNPDFGKNKKNIINLSSAENAQREVNDGKRRTFGLALWNLITCHCIIYKRFTKPRVQLL